MQDHVIEALPHDYHKGLRVRSYYVLKAVDVLHGKGHKQLDSKRVNQTANEGGGLHLTLTTDACNN